MTMNNDNVSARERVREHILGKRIRMPEPQELPRKRLFRCAQQNRIIAQMERLHELHSVRLHANLYDDFVRYLWQSRCAFFQTNDPPNCMAHDVLVHMVQTLQDPRMSDRIPLLVNHLIRYFHVINAIFETRRLQESMAADRTDSDSDSDSDSNLSDYEAETE